MRRVLLVLSLCALALVVANAAVAYPFADRLARGAISPHDYLAYLCTASFLANTAILGSFAVGVLACALAVQGHQRGWIAVLSGAVLVSAYFVDPVLGEINAADNQRLARLLLEHAPGAQLALEALRTGLPALAALLYALAMRHLAQIGQGTQ